MAYSVLAINPGHNGSAALVVDGELIYYSEEERISRLKYDGNPFRAMLHVLINHKVDELVIGGTTSELSKLPWTMEDSYTALARKFNPGVKVTLMGHLHHLGHAAAAFYNSGFDTAAAVVVDGAGTHYRELVEHTGQTVSGYETESIYQCAYPHEFNALYKRYSDGQHNTPYYDNGIQEFDCSTTITKAYEAVSEYLGFGFIEAGKTMGLAPYGKHDENIPPFFVNNKGNKNLLINSYPAGAHIDENRFPYIKKFTSPSEWHRDFNLVRDVDKNLAYHVQRDTEEQMIALIEKAIDITGETNIVISGGFGLNCVANYKYVKHFKDIRFYVDPVAHDGGTSIGLAMFAWYNHSQSTQKSHLKSVYLGAIPEYRQLDLVAQQIPDMRVEDTTPTEVAQLIANGNCVALFQGRAEAGPRALGNRSILFDPRNPDGKDIVNIIKKREWFRPFAGSVLEEHAQDYFEMETLESSPHMMYAVNVRSEKQALMPAVTHVDGTCRVQTVNKDYNPAYYQLISEFGQLTGVPVLFNTSLNLAGQPLVDSVFDACVVLYNSDLRYVYMPDIGKLIIKP